MIVSSFLEFIFRDLPLRGFRDYMKVENNKVSVLSYDIRVSTRGILPLHSPQGSDSFFISASPKEPFLDTRRRSVIDLDAHHNSPH